MYEIIQRVAASHTDAEGRLKFVSAMDMMQDCSQLWLESEPDVTRYFKEQGIAQLLVSRQADVVRMPCYGERLSVRTSVYDCQNFLGYRNTVIYDEAGLPCIKSWANGAFVIMETGRPAKLPAELLERLTMDPRVEMEYLGKKIRLPDEAGEDLPPVQVSRNDIDFNRHMNNARYVQIAMEYPGEDFAVSRFRIEYKRPAKYGDLLYPRLVRAGSATLYVVLNNEAGEPYTVMELIGSGSLWALSPLTT
jgi:acyl-CoA thioesterase FadM